MPDVKQILDALHVHAWYPAAALILLLATQLFKKAPVLRDLWAKVPDGWRGYLIHLGGGIVAFTAAFSAGLPITAALMAFVGGVLGISIPAMGMNAALTDSHIPWNGGAGGAAKPVGMLVLMFAASSALAQSACTPAQVAAVESAVSKIVVAAIQSGEVLDMVQQKADQVFAAVPNPDLQRKVNKGIIDGKSAVAAVLKASQGVGAAANKDAEAAAQRFQAAWNALQPLLADAGVIKGSRLGVAVDDVEVPEPLLLKVK